jgi:hypothetical protein
MDALIDAKPEWADQDTFEADRGKMLHYCRAAIRVEVERQSE